MYHAQKMSFQAAVTLSGLGFNDFKKRLRIYFSTGYIIAPEVIEDDISMAKNFSVKSEGCIKYESSNISGQCGEFRYFVFLF